MVFCTAPQDTKHYEQFRGHNTSKQQDTSHLDSVFIVAILQYEGNNLTEKNNFMLRLFSLFYLHDVLLQFAEGF